MIKARKHDAIFYIFIVVLVVAIIGANYVHQNQFPLLYAKTFASDFDYEVIVVGADPEGIAAAVAASRSGAKVLLVDEHADVGGLFTYGMLNTLDMNYGARNRLLTKGIFYEFYRQLEGSSFDVKNARNVLHNMVAKEANITFWHKTKFLKAVVNKRNEIIGINVLKDGIQKQVLAARIIDATQDGDVAASADVPYMYGGADRGYPNKAMAATLVFSLHNVDWDTIKEILLHDGDQLTGADRFSAWGFSDEMRDYKPNSERLKMRGLNLGRQRDGSVLVNGFLIFDVNGTSAASKSNAKLLATEELPHIVQFLRDNVPGLENVTLGGMAQDLYIRESRHIFGEYRLTINDILENKDHWDRIAIGSYPVDVQAIDNNSFGLIFGKPVQYSIPFRSIVPLKIDNLLVVGRAASYTSVAAGSARVVPVGMCEGEAAGVAAAYSISNGISFRRMTKDKAAIADIQAILKLRGGYLEAFNIFTPYTLHWSYPAVRVLMPTGAIQSRYINDFKYDQPITERQFLSIAMGLLRVLKGEEAASRFYIDYLKSARPLALTSNEACYYILQLNGYLSKYTVDQNYLTLAKKEGLLTPLLLSKGFGGTSVSYAHAYELLAHTYVKLLKHSSNVFAPSPQNGK